METSDIPVYIFMFIICGLPILLFGALVVGGAYDNITSFEVNENITVKKVWLEQEGSFGVDTKHFFSDTKGRTFELTLSENYNPSSVWGQLKENHNYSMVIKYSKINSHGTFVKLEKEV